jgi:histidyl-tRNA synthetase
MRDPAFKIAQELRRNGISTDVDLARRKLKKVLSYADNLGTKYVVLVGARDIEAEKVTIKNLESGNQELIELNKITEELLKKLNTDD